ncbi:hypothetical protein CHARACLAT_031529 [Characodon lateralis]|uniref:Uncharacterized protein n=1 Tax=Characodon lateralis TaxID=208331 RepID=A0ABU7ERM4_9TELE|nr:hypothetical protein [Characodon lateralis]
MDQNQNRLAFFSVLHQFLIRSSSGPPRVQTRLPCTFQPSDPSFLLTFQLQRSLTHLVTAIISLPVPHRPIP